MILIYKKIKKRNERKRLEDQQPDQPQQLETTNESPASEGHIPSTVEKDVSPEEKAEKKLRRTYRLKLILGLFGPFCLSSLDTTIVASALPYIATDFNQLSQLNWIISSFNLTSAASLFLWAQLTDLFGRHNTLQAATLTMVLGSAICTGSPTSKFSVLLLGRAIQGIGAAGVTISVRTILADGVSLSDYAVNWTIFAIVAGVGFSIGPVIGGYLTTASWRWCFAINLPIGILAMIVLLILLRKDLLGPQPLVQLDGRDLSTRSKRFIARVSTIDFGGQMLFLWGFGLLILGLTWAGGNYSWNSAAVIAPLVLGGIMAIAWVVYERLMAPDALLARALPRQKAMMPWKVLSQRNIALLFAINFTMGASMFAVMYFMDLYFDLVEGKSSSSSGTALLYFLPGYGGGAYFVMFACNFWPRQTLPILLVGSIATAVGITVLASAVHKSQTDLIYGMMALVGFGVGSRMNPASLHGLAFFPTMTAQVTSLVAFALPFGGLVGLTIMSTVFENKSGVDESDPRSGIKWAFVAMMPFMWIGVLLTTLLGNVWLLKGGGHEVVNGAYLWSFVTRKKLVRERRDRRLDLGSAGEVKGKSDIEDGTGTGTEVRDRTTS
ncbi:Major facilitator superfamily domain general substrate transporter [Penicillium malachiteum]|uniref:Major facilitator superfamily domain general substrate transporter n=1 Tax=Penicillium malachiteum TaxID=1324776 RepID=UPI0025477272|nr:Major facilitator superfamily domain general substrate transporter [Penicillium malachiteum]KAJ5725110.1 Major facilitator superfamily domain general substrate transporter [Penicillium malachiteum]